MTLINKIKIAAQKACFYVTPEGNWLRMQWCDPETDKFCAADEESGEDYIFSFDEITENNPHFEELKRIDLAS